ncbi:MAG: TIM44-like domain-containing protein [Vagococcus sp.]|uniref:TIM44-like domain-containing protein n=1 Tax=Vagococcus TaxID=2737 RepID=UPI002FC9E425
MNKKILKIALNVLLCLAIIIIIYNFYPILVDARAGGGGNTGGSSSSSSDNSIMKFVLTILLMPFLLIKRFFSNMKENALYTDIDNLEKWEYRVLFMNIQSAWSYGDMIDVKERMDPTLYEDFQQKLAEYKRVNKRNVLTDIQIDKVKVSRASQNKNMKEILFEGTIIDYFEENGVPPQGEIKPISFKDIWIIERTETSIIVRDIQNL